MNVINFYTTVSWIRWGVLELHYRNQPLKRVPGCWWDILQAQSTQDVGRDAQRNTSKWDLLMWMGVSTLHASNKSKEKCSNLCACCVPHPAWIGPYKFIYFLYFSSLSFFLIFVCRKGGSQDLTSQWEASSASPTTVRIPHSDTRFVPDDATAENADSAFWSLRIPPCGRVIQNLYLRSKPLPWLLFQNCWLQLGLGSPRVQIFDLGYSSTANSWCLMITNECAQAELRFCCLCWRFFFVNSLSLNSWSVFSTQATFAKMALAKTPRYCLFTQPNFTRAPTMHNWWAKHYQCKTAPAYAVKPPEW